MIQKLTLPIIISLILCGCFQTKKKSITTDDPFILVKGGLITNQKSQLQGSGIKLYDFYIAKYEVTQREWKDVMNDNPSAFKGDSLPVENISWYDCIEYCNKRSIKEGLSPYYNINKDEKDPVNVSDLDSLKWIITLNTKANGYRLPAEIEWEYAAGGGQLSNSYEYSGSDDVDAVAWHWGNSGDAPLNGIWQYNAVAGNNCRSHPVGMKKPNELGIYDMSGNVREWCVDWYEDESVQIGRYRQVRGGGWLGVQEACSLNFRMNYRPNNISTDTGLRLCRNK